MKQKAKNEVYVWDPLIRVFHWTLVAAFTVAFLTEGDEVHVWAGYVVGALILLRLIWGFTGPRHARFRNFLYSPKAIIKYVWGLLTFRSERYIGHSPGGGAMVIALLVSLAITTGSGIAVYGIEERAGPLAGLFASNIASAPQSLARSADESDREDFEDERKRTGESDESPLGEVMEEIHEFFANFTLSLIFVHIAAVIFASFSHRENLTKAMFNGRKRR